MTNQEERDPNASDESMIEDPEFGMKDLTETLEDMGEQQRERLPQGGQAERAGQLPEGEAERLIEGE